MPRDTATTQGATSTTSIAPGSRLNRALRARKLEKFTSSGSGTVKADFGKLKCAFSQAKKLLDAQKLCPQKIVELYDSCFPVRNLNGWTSIRNPRFSEKTYPSLFTELRLLGNPSRGDNWSGIPEWNSETLTAAIATGEGNNALLRVLLAFVWKQGDFQKLEALLKGLGGKPLGEGVSTGAVMWQLGNHLRDPLNEPIFDRYTSLAFLLFDRVKHCDNIGKFREIFNSESDPVPFQDTQLNNASQLASYKAWWVKAVKCKLPDPPSPFDDRWPESGRALAMLYWDRLMFSLGKAALGIYKAKDKGKRRTKTSQ